MGFNVRFDAGNAQSGLNVKSLFKILNEATASVKLKLAKIASARSSISIGDMFEMQMLMNHLSQLSDMSTNVVSASHQAIMSMSRNVKG